MRKPKCIKQRNHTVRRARERLGITLAGSDLADACHQIRSGQAKFLLKQSHRISLFAVATNGQPWIAAYDKSRKTICTCLTVHMVAKRWPELHIPLTLGCESV